MLFLAAKIVLPYIGGGYLVNNFVAQGVPFVREYGAIVGESHNPTMPYLPILLVVAILIPLLVLVYKKFSR